MDLDSLVRLFSGGATRVVGDPDGTWLESDDFNALGDPAAVRDVARLLMRSVNASALLEDAGFKPVALSDHYHDGKTRTVLLEAHLEARSSMTATLTGPGGVPRNALPMRSDAAKWVDTAKADPVVAEVLSWLAGREPDWVALYKVYEILRDAEALGLASTADWKAFTSSSNNVKVSGDGARHARSPAGTPRRTMTLAEAQLFIRGVTREWITQRSSP